MNPWTLKKVIIFIFCNRLCCCCCYLRRGKKILLTGNLEIVLVGMRGSSLFQATLNAFICRFPLNKILFQLYKKAKINLSFQILFFFPDWTSVHWRENPEFLPVSRKLLWVIPWARLQGLDFLMDALMTGDKSQRYLYSLRNCSK